MSAPRKEFTTKSGLTLPLMNLKGKEYLMACHRIHWFVTENERFTIESTILESSPGEYASVKTTIKVLDKDNQVIRSADGVKTEHKKHFEDYLEKAITGATSRALSYLGYGTQFSGDELNELVNEKGQEVNRLADAPIEAAQKTFTPKVTVMEEVKAEAPKKSGFGIKKKTEVKVEEAANDGWE